MRTKGAPEANERSFGAEPAVTAILACVRGLTRGAPAHASRHTLQLQFHCGKPPPAAEPSIKAERRPMRRLSFPESEKIPLSDRNGPRAQWIRTRPADSR